MTSATKKKIAIGVGLLGLLLAIGLGVFLFKRQQFLNYALAQVKAKVERKYPVTLTLGPARFTDLNSVRIEGVSLVPTSGDTLLRARQINASLSLRSLFARRPVFSNLQIDEARFTARKTATADNYSFLYRKRKGEAAVPRDTTKGTNYPLLLNQLLEAGFDNIPDDASFQDFLVTYHSPRHVAVVTMPTLTIEDGDINGEITALIDSVSNRVGVSGHVEPGDYELAARVYGLDRQPVILPFLQRRAGARVQFDTLRVSLDGKDYSKEELTLRGAASAVNFRLNQPKLSDEDIVVNHGGINFTTRLGQTSFALEKGTKIRLNKVEFYPELSISKRPLNQRVVGKKVNGVEKRTDLLAGLLVTASVKSDEMPANDFFASLPAGMFTELEGTQGEGTLTYRMSLGLDMNQVDSLKFDSSLQGKNFRLTRFGREDLSKLNQEFAYTAYNDKGDSIKTFAVGPSNPDFVPYNQVSPFLKKAIQTAEDPRFFQHRGFMEKAFVKSAIQNIKERRFARGGSTLSMQLVKNVFLTRQKTVGRKVEEMLIVWLLENTRLVSKERMFEVYLNIIEWGPKIYGVKDAARFYFAKQPASLDLSESLYLASIIPRPKYYRNAFNQYGEMMSNGRYFHRLIADLMERKGLISPAERSTLTYDLAFSGAARSSIVRATRPVVSAFTVDSAAQQAPIDLLDLLGAPGPDEGVNATAPAPATPVGPPRP